MIRFMLSKQRAAGFTLAELLVTVTLASILLSLAAPGFGEVISRNQITVQGNNLIASLQSARHFAVVNHEMVQVCQIKDAQTPECSDDYSRYRNWSAGWMTFIDMNQDNNFDSNDEIIKIYQGTDLIKIVFNQRGRLRYFPDGSARSAGFTLCDTQRQHYRHVYLLHTGRARMNSDVSEKQRKKCDAIASPGEL